MKKMLLAIAIATAIVEVRAETRPIFRLEDRIRIKEAIRIRDLYGEQIWKGISQIHFTLLLISDSTEFLVGHPKPGRDFSFYSDDSILNSKVYFRKAKFNPTFLATFGSLNGYPTIIAGTPEQTGKHSTAWIITLLHEHFHQYQYNDTAYPRAVEQLDLSGGDKTGMWMLNYPFPYEQQDIADQYNRYTASLTTCIRQIDSAGFQPALQRLLAERNKFTSLLAPAAHRYFSLQVWQEGIARYTEYKFLSIMDHYVPPIEVAALGDFVPYIKLRDQIFKTELNNITSLSLHREKRLVFYALGFGEGIILDRLNRIWRDRYLPEKFSLEKFF